MGAPLKEIYLEQMPQGRWGLRCHLSIQLPHFPISYHRMTVLLRVKVTKSNKMNCVIWILHNVDTLMFQEFLMDDVTLKYRTNNCREISLQWRTATSWCNRSCTDRPTAPETLHYLLISVVCVLNVYNLQKGITQRILVWIQSADKGLIIQITFEF